MPTGFFHSSDSIRGTTTDCRTSSPKGLFFSFVLRHVKDDNKEKVNLLSRVGPFHSSHDIRGTATMGFHVGAGLVCFSFVFH